MAGTAQSDPQAILDGLNAQQRQAVEHDDGPLLIIAGAGTGKTRTLVHRVAQLIHRGVPAHRILLLTFTRRAAAEMLRRVDGLLRQLGTSLGRGVPAGGRAVWGGTFHAVAARLLRLYAPAAGLGPEFTILDRSDSEDLLDVVRTELGFSKLHKRFPRKGTCLAIYSHCVNSSRSLEEVLAGSYPWCRDWVDQLKKLFHAYGERKEQGAILDYDDLLLFWRGLLEDEQVGPQIRQRFDAVLVDEYQDTNRVQAEILRGLRPGGRGLTAVGDDAQSIYAFRAATIRNILDFPAEYPGTTVVTLEQNYRSTQPILDATNRVIAQARQRYTKDLWTSREGGGKPRLVACSDETDQASYVIDRILEHREESIDLKRQAVLYRTSHHSILLEGELTRRNIPYVKFGGLKFIETAHVKDLLAFLRLAENPRDLVAGSRVLQLMPGIGPARARQLMDQALSAGGRLEVWSQARVPDAAKAAWTGLLDLLRRLTAAAPGETSTQVQLVRQFFEPILEERYDHAGPRKRDLEQMEQLATRFANRQSFLAQLALDPPDSSEDLAGPPLLDEDYLILSTIHSAKGLEWDVVYVIHASDGNIPSDMATGDEEEIAEELRLFYVALTRARQHLYVCHPVHYYHAGQAFTDRHTFAQLTRFIPRQVKTAFACAVPPRRLDAADPGVPPAASASRGVRHKIQSRWQ